MPDITPATDPNRAMADLAEKVDAVLSQQHRILQLMYRLAVPVDVVTTAEAAKRLGKSVPTMERLAARCIFTDGRAPGNRTTGSPRLYYADEIDVYRSEGEAGLRRLRLELGRAREWDFPESRAGRTRRRKAS